MAEEATQTTWLSGRPRRVLTIRPPPTLPSGYTEYREWSFKDDQIMLALPPPNAIHDARESVSTIYLADIQDGLSREDGVIEFKLIATLSFYAMRTALLSDRAGFFTVEFRAALRDCSKAILEIEDKDNEGDLTLRIHNWNGEVTKETTILAAAFGGSIAIRGSSIAICVGIKPNLLIDECDVGPLNQIVTWNVDSGAITRTKIPQDERAPLCHKGNFQFVGPSHLALGGCVDPAFDHCPALKSFSTTSAREPVRYFCRDMSTHDDEHDALAIPGSSMDNDFIVHHHQFRNRFAVLNKGTLTGEIPSNPVPTPSSIVEPDYYEGLFREISDQDDFRVLSGSPCDFLPSLVENRLLIRERYNDYSHDKQQYHVVASDMGSRSFYVLYLYDFDQNRCNSLRHLTLPERQQLETQLKQQNADARVRVVSRRYCVTEDGEEYYYEQIQFPGWWEHEQKLEDVQSARGKGEAEFPLLEFDEAPKGQNEDAHILFLRSMICLPPMREFGKVALTPSAIVYLPEGGEDGEDGYAFYFGKEITKDV